MPGQKPTGVDEAALGANQRTGDADAPKGRARTRKAPARAADKKARVARAGRPLSLKRRRERAALFFERLAAIMPEPRTELVYHDPFTLLVAVLLSAQATDVGVNKATARLFARARTPAAMLALGLDGVREEIRTIGLFNNKAKNVMALCEQLIAQHGGEVPADRAALEALPGVGRKTANVVLCEAFGMAAIAVDTHVFRVANRTGLAPGKTPLAVETALMDVVPQAYLVSAHHWLILHGRYLCKARRPECWRCPVADLCTFEPKSPAPPEPRGAVPSDDDPRLA